MALTRRHRCSVVGLLLAGLGAVAARGAGLPPEVEESIRLRLEHGYSVGIVIGIVNADGVQYY